jgi:hypothetical protein
MDVRGKMWHPRNVNESGWKSNYGKPTRCPKPSTLEKIDVPGKHRYLMPLDAAMRAQIAPLAKPYPKKPRVGSVDSDTSPAQGEEGGASPTPTPQP